GRRGGTDEFLGRGTLVPPSPWCSGQGGRPLDKCLVQLHADAVVRKSHAAVSETVNSSPVVTPRKRKITSAFCGAPIDRRGHIRVRPCPGPLAAPRPPLRPCPRRPGRQRGGTGRPPRSSRSRRCRRPRAAPPGRTAPGPD